MMLSSPAVKNKWRGSNQSHDLSSYCSAYSKKKCTRRIKLSKASGMDQYRGSKCIEKLSHHYLLLTMSFGKVPWHSKSTFLVSFLEQAQPGNHTRSG